DARRMAAGAYLSEGQVANLLLLRSFDRHHAAGSGTVLAVDTGGTCQMGMRSSSLAVLLLLAAARAFAAACTDPTALRIDLSQQAFCDPLVPEQCMLPFPNDYFTVADSRSPPRRRIHFTPEGLPKNTSAVPLEAAELNRSDGFSPGAAVLFWMP